MEFQIQPLEETPKARMNEAINLTAYQIEAASTLMKVKLPGRPEPELLGAIIQALATNYATTSTVVGG